MLPFTRIKTYLLFFLFSSVAFPQNSILDSLKTKIANPKLHDTTRLRMIHDVAGTRFSTGHEPEFHQVIDLLGSVALKNYNKKNNPKLQQKYAKWSATYYSSLATRYLQKEEYDKSERYYDKAIALYKEAKNEDEMYTVYLSKSRLYSATNENDKAIALIFEALKFYEKNKNAHMHSLYYVYATLAFLYRYEEEYEKAIQYSLKAEQYCDLSYKEVPSNHTLNWKAAVYGNIAYCYSQLKKSKESLVYAYKGLELHKKIGADVQVGLSLAGIASTEMQLSNYAQAEKIYQEILALKSVATDNMTQATAYYGLGRLSFHKGDMAQASVYQEKAFELAKKTTSKTIQRDIAEELYKINLAAKNYEKALQYYEFDKKITDSTKTASSKKEISQQQLKYEFEKKQLQQKIEQQQKLEALKIEAAEEKAAEVSRSRLVQQQLLYDFQKRQLTQKIEQGKKLSAVKLESQKKTAAIKLDAEKQQAAQKNWLIGLSGVLLLLTLGGIFYYRNNKQKQAIAGLEKNQIKQKLLITQMNPHFIFNSVQNIRNLIDRHKNDDAVKYLDQFSILTRQILENSNENYISLEEEVAMTQNYLSIQQLLYNHKFDFKIEVNDDIEMDSTFLPPMLTQPFIENAIKHGLSNKSANGMIEIKFFLDAGKLFFEVTDNGKGFDATKTISNHKSLAMTITKERLVGYTKNQDFVVVTDNIKDQNENVVGAKVRFEIPYIYEN